MRWIIGRLTIANWVAHLVLILTAAAAAAILASPVEGEVLRKVITAVLWVLVLMQITQNLVERFPGGRVSYGIPYAVCAAGSIFMLAGQSLTSESLIANVSEVSGLLFAIGLSLFAFQVRGLRRPV